MKVIIGYMILIILFVIFFGLMYVIGGLPAFLLFFIPCAVVSLVILAGMLISDR